VNAQGGEYGNALYAASHKGFEGIVGLLLEKGANVNAQGGICDNALMAASYRGHEAIVGLLVENGADMNTQDEKYEMFFILHQMQTIKSLWACCLRRGQM
jgi:ankyrin repeat protein